ncbi:MAG TPA: hypothetical protein DCR40_17190 [Prolixibacteraceae bacterium]|nr:hypothetical protein [Prolixibacteraceae bacterium]
MKKLLIICILFPFALTGQNTVNADQWIPFNSFFGEWTGQGGGESGIGTYERSYQIILNGKFIEVRNKSTYPPSASNAKGEVHEDLGYISYDRALKKLRLRQFHIEGFVNEYFLDSISPDQKLMVFVTESIENIPSGWKAKETYRILSENELEETFELAEPGKEYAGYSKVLLKRVK